MKKNTVKIIKNYGAEISVTQEVEQILDEKRSSGYFTGKNGVQIYYQTYRVEDEKGRVVLCHGFCECLDKYHEIIYYLMEAGYSVFGIEHRGHGRSSSMGKCHNSQIDIDQFDYYVEDLKAFVDQFVAVEKAKLYLLAHSMGGGIGTLFLERYPEYFDKAILSSPMMKICTGQYPELLAKCIAQGFVLFGKGGQYILGNKPYDGQMDLEGSGTSCEARYCYHENKIAQKEELQRGGGSFRWLLQAIKATKELRKKENIQKIQIPILLFQAGKDTYVKAEGQNEFYHHAKNCKLSRVDQGKHELYFESDEILERYLKEVLDFLK